MRKEFAPLALAALCLAPSPARAGDGATLRAMIETVRIDSPSISPDGRLAVWREIRPSIDHNDYRLAWFFSPVDGSAGPRRMADAGQPMWLNGTMLANPPVWTADSRALLFRKQEEGQVQVWRVDIDASEARQLSHEPGNVRNLVSLDGGRRIAITTGPARADIVAAEKAERDQGTLIDDSVDPQRPLYRGDWIDGRWATGRLRGAWFEQGGILPARPPLLQILDIDTGETSEPSSIDRQHFAPPAKAFDRLGDLYVIERDPSGDARGIAVTLGKGSQYSLAVIGDAGKVIARCAAPVCSGPPIRSVKWQGKENALILETRNDAGDTVLWRWSVADGAMRQIATSPNTLNGGDFEQGCATSDGTFLCVEGGANQPTRLVSIAIADGSRRVLAEPNRHVDPAEPQFDRLNWTDGKGHAFTGFLALPVKRARPVPLFITYYSCSGYLRGGLGEEFPLRDLARAGIAALCINRYPGKLGIGGNVDAYRIAASSIATEIDRLAREGLIDRQRVGMGGVSFGGEVAVWLAMHTRLLRAVSVANVMVSPTYYWLNTVKGRDVRKALLTGWGLGNPDTDRTHWRDVSPAFNTDRIVAPLLMQVPEQEYRPNVELLARLQAAGKPVELWAFPSEMHLKWQPRHQLAANLRNLDWFRYWLTGTIDPDPAKAEQYARWRAYGSPNQARAQASVSAKGKSR
jgi:hypothetical protein